MSKPRGGAETADDGAEPRSERLRPEKCVDSEDRSGERNDAEDGVVRDGLVGHGLAAPGALCLM